MEFIAMGRKKLAKANYLSFETFRKTGVGVATPVWFAEEDGVFYLFSAQDAGKIKRLRNSPRSRIAACTVSGRITGEWVDTEAQILTEPADSKQALGALRRKYGWQMTMTDFMSRLSGKMGQRAYIAVSAS
jgi:PPOX class probable F420-dependent enzyme